MNRRKFLGGLGGLVGAAVLAPQWLVPSEPLPEGLWQVAAFNHPRVVLSGDTLNVTLDTTNRSFVRLRLLDVNGRPTGEWRQVRVDRRSGAAFASWDVIGAATVMGVIYA